MFAASYLARTAQMNGAWAASRQSADLPLTAPDACGCDLLLHFDALRLISECFYSILIGDILIMPE